MLLGMVLYQFGGMTSRFITLYKEEKGFEKRIAELREKNEAMKKEIEYTETDGFLEREGKSRLNLKKPGEEVVVIVEENTPPSEGAPPRGFWERLFGAFVSVMW